MRRSLENKNTADHGGVKSALPPDDQKALDSRGVDASPQLFFESFIMQGIKLDVVEPGRILCSLSGHPRLVRGDEDTMHEGAIATLVDSVGESVVRTLVPATTIGVSVEINVSYFDTAHVGDEIGIETKALVVGNTIAVVTVELRKQKTGKLIAHGRHSMFMAVPSKM